MSTAELAGDRLHLLTRAELAELIGRSERYIEKAEAAGTFPIPRVAGFGIRYSLFDYERYIAGGHLAAPARRRSSAKLAALKGGRS